MWLLWCDTGTQVNQSVQELSWMAPQLPDEAEVTSDVQCLAEALQVVFAAHCASVDQFFISLVVPNDAWSGEHVTARAQT